MHSSTQYEVLILSSNAIISEALVSGVRQAGWDAARFEPDRDVRLGQVARVVVGPIAIGTNEESVLATLSGASTIILDESVAVVGATTLPSSAGMHDLLATLNKMTRAERKLAITPRHAQILQFVADGLTVQEAATKLGITSKTVNNHLGSVYRRLGVENLTQAVLQSIRLGFVDPSRRFEAAKP